MVASNNIFVIGEAINIPMLPSDNINDCLKDCSMVFPMIAPNIIGAAGIFNSRKTIPSSPNNINI